MSIRTAARRMKAVDQLIPALIGSQGPCHSRTRLSLTYQVASENRLSSPLAGLGRTGGGKTARLRICGLCRSSCGFVPARAICAQVGDHPVREWRGSWLPISARNELVYCFHVPLQASKYSWWPNFSGLLYTYMYVLIIPMHTWH